MQQPEEERRACNLYLSLMERMGLQTNRFGDADRPLKWL
jgi:phenylalanine-4-hydroxylase